MGSIADRVTLREITAETVRAVTKLSVTEQQHRFVAPNAVSLAQALFAPEAWYRAIYLGDEPIGFVMLSDDSLLDPLPESPKIGLWRFMVGAEHQHQGVGRAAMHLVIEHVRRKGLFEKMSLSYVPVEGSPERFYRSFGFRPTGEMDEDEVVMELVLREPAAPPVAIGGAPMPIEPFATTLQGGHPNSLGRTDEVVGLVLAAPPRLDELYRCYFADDEVVRLRTSSALKRVCALHPDWLLPYVDGLLGEVARIPQPSAQWTLAQLMTALGDRFTDAQRARATEVLKRNLASATDWIVLIQTMQTLAAWAEADVGLKEWVELHLLRLAEDPRKSVAGKARRLRAVLGAEERAP